MAIKDLQQANQEAQDAWNQNAAYWNEHIGEGNDFVEVLIWPATKRLLELQPGQRVLDVACGNGLYARRLAAMGAEVVAFDFAPALIARAVERTGQAAGMEHATCTAYAVRTEHAACIDYRVLDATDEGALLALGERQFDAALCNMALFDMAEIDPLMRALARLLRPNGRLMFSVIHPCFNNPHMTHVAEMEDQEGNIVTRYSIKVRAYIRSTVARAAAIRGQPKPQPIFHRPLQALFGAGFDAGFVLDALEEPAFPPDHPAGQKPLSWGGNFWQIPPVLVARMRLLERSAI